MAEESSGRTHQPKTARLFRLLIIGIIIGLTVGIASTFLKGGF